MDDFLKAEREAARKASELHHVGWEVGAGATIWARAIQDILALHESARERFETGTADRETWERLHGTAQKLSIESTPEQVFSSRATAGSSPPSTRSPRAFP